MKKIVVYFLLILVSKPAIAQSDNLSGRYDINKKRLLVQTSGLYLFASNQGQIDIDSAMLLSCIGQGLPRTFWYEEIYNKDNSILPGRDLLARDDLNAAKKLLSRLTGEDQLQLLLQISSYYLFKPGTVKEDLNQSYYFLQQGIVQSKLLAVTEWQDRCKLLSGRYYLQTGEMQKSKECFAAIVADARKARDEEALAIALANQGTWLPYDDSTKSIALTEAMNLFEKLGNSEKQIEMLMKIIGIDFRSGRFEITKSELQQSLHLQQANNFRHVHYTEATIAFIHIMEGNLDKALEQSLSSIRNMELTQDTAYAENFYLRLGNIYNILGRWDDAILIYKKCMQNAGKNQSNGLWYKNTLSLIQSLTALGRDKDALAFIQSTSRSFPPQNTWDKMLLAFHTGMCYKNLNQPDSAEKYFSRVPYFAEQLNSPEAYADIAYCYSHMAIFFADRGKINMAREYCQKTIGRQVGQQSIFIAFALELAFFKIDSAENHFLSSIQHLKNYKLLSDSMASQTKYKKIEKLKVMYETEQKENDIRLLENQSKLQLAELDRGRLIKNLTLGGIALSLLVTGLLYNRYRLKQKNNQQLQKLVAEKEILLKEKDWLVKEIHHRVKNNLQIVISLMNIQSEYLENGAAFDAVKESQSRMTAMSLLHQKLYLSPSITSIAMNSYISELIQHLKESFNAGNSISFKTEIQPIELEVSQAVPLGLILNEAVTNAIKYAFPDNKNGEIHIKLIQTGIEISLVIADNGVGLPEHSAFKKASTIGFNLIETLTEQLGGSLNVQSHDGVELSVVFFKEIMGKTG